MKKLIKSSQSIKSTTADYYDSRFKYNYAGQKFSGYIKYEDQPWNLQFTLTEVHPYDDADYYWAKKDAPASVSLIQGTTRKYTISVPEYDADLYEDDNDYVDEVIDITCKHLRELNASVQSKVVHW